MESRTRLQQKKLIQRTQRRLNRLMDLLMKAHLSKRSNHVDTEVFQEFVRRSLAAQMINSGFSSGPFGLTTSGPLEGTLNTTSEPDMDLDFTNMCQGW